MCVCEGGGVAQRMLVTGQQKRCPAQTMAGILHLDFRSCLSLRKGVPYSLPTALVCHALQSPVYLQPLELSVGQPAYGQGRLDAAFGGSRGNG